MGMYVSFVAMTPELLTKAENDPEWAEEYIDDFYAQDELPDNAEVDLEKSWAGLIYLMEAENLGFGMLDSGVRIIADDNCIDSWNAQDVKTKAKTLSATPFEKLAAHYNPASMMAEDVYPQMWEHDPESELESLQWNYERLVEFFAATAASGNGVLMSWG